MPSLSIDAPDNLVSDGKRMLFSSGEPIVRLSNDGAGTEQSFIVSTSRSRRSLAAGRHAALIALGGGVTVSVAGRLRRQDGDRQRLPAQGLVCTDRAAASPTHGELLVAQGSASRAGARMAARPDGPRRRGSVWRIDARAAGGEAQASPTGSLGPTGSCSTATAAIAISRKLAATGSCWSAARAARVKPAAGRPAGLSGAAAAPAEWRLAGSRSSRRAAS